MDWDDDACDQLTLKLEQIEFMSRIAGELADKSKNRELQIAIAILEQMLKDLVKSLEKI